MKFKILSFDGKKIERENVISVTLQTKAGEITVLDNHVPLLTSVKPSTIYYIYTDENNIKQRDDIAI
jgi:F0F1-type ATP synthase epsilon subunit